MHWVDTPEEPKAVGREVAGEILPLEWGPFRGSALKGLAAEVLEESLPAIRPAALAEEGEHWAGN